MVAAQRPQRGSGLTWTDRTAAPAGERATARRAGAPLARSAAVLVTAGMLLGGGPATADGVRYGGVGGRILPTAAERAVTADADRLGALAQRTAAAARSESLAVAGAALEAAVGAQRLATTLAPEQVPADLLPATERLAGLLAEAGVPTRSVPPWRVTATAPAADGDAAGGDVVDVDAADGGDVVDGDAVAVATASDLREPGGDVPGALLLSAELAGTAGEVFRLSMEVESLSRAAAQAEELDRAAGLGALELAATSAGAAAVELAALEPLTPLAEGELQLDRPEVAGTVVASVNGRARLRADAPAGVAALVRQYGNGQIPAEALCGVTFARGALFQCDAADALELLNAAYRAEFGTDLQVSSSYRTLEAQVSLKASKGFLAATPGTSNHGWGLAVDLGGIGGLGDFGAPQYLWLKQHADAFGWHHPRGMEPGGSGPQEPWHWEFATA